VATGCLASTGAADRARLLAVLDRAAMHHTHRDRGLVDGDVVRVMQSIRGNERPNNERTRVVAKVLMAA
jgi:hypothetical protein